jgi:DNA-binding MurR/RpiR family transcriptional regulator
MSLAAPLTELIANASATLTPTERRIAREIVDDPTALAFGTVADLAARVETSGPTIVRFAAKLGFEGYSALQERARADLADQLRKPTDRIRRSSGADPTDVWDRARAEAINGVEAVFAAVGPEEVRQLARLLTQVDSTVWVMGAETASAPAQVLFTGLQLLRPGVRHLGGSPAEVAADVADVAPGDVALVIDFPRYEQLVVDAANWLSEAGAMIAAVTDGPLSPLAEVADLWYAINVAAIGPFDTALPVIALVEVVLAEVADQLRDGAASRLEAIEARWGTSGVYLTG